MNKLSLTYRPNPRYVPAYAYLDDSIDIGVANVIAEGTADDDTSDTGGVEKTFILEVTLDGEPQPKGIIMNAIEDAFSMGCGCEHDCCGHYFGSGEAEHVKGNLWRVNAYYSRNY